MAGGIVATKEDIIFYFNTDEEGNITDSAALIGTFSTGGHTGDKTFENHVMIDSWDIPMNINKFRYQHGTFLLK